MGKGNPRDSVFVTSQMLVMARGLQTALMVFVLYTNFTIFLLQDAAIRIAATDSNTVSCPS